MIGKKRRNKLQRHTEAYIITPPVSLDRSWLNEFNNIEKNHQQWYEWLHLPSKYDGVTHLPETTNVSTKIIVNKFF